MVQERLLIDGHGRVPRGASVIAFAVAFALWVAAIVALVVAGVGFLASTGLRYLSSVCSGFAIVASAGAVWMTRRR